MQQLCRQFEPAFVVMRDAESAQQLARAIVDLSTEVLAGEAGLAEVAAAAEVDVVVAAIVGAVGLLSTLAAVRAGKRILLANKEALVMAGALFMDEVQQHGRRTIAGR